MIKECIVIGHTTPVCHIAEAQERLPDHPCFCLTKQQRPRMSRIIISPPIIPTAKVGSSDGCVGRLVGALVGDAVVGAGVDVGALVGALVGASVVGALVGTPVGARDVGASVAGAGVGCIVVGGGVGKLVGAFVEPQIGGSLLHGRQRTVELD